MNTATVNEPTVVQQRREKALAYLDAHRGRAVPAIELARHLCLPGNRETQRRTVRHLVESLHKDGQQICASAHGTEGGYWVARDAGEWRRYLESRKSRAVFTFVVVRAMREAASEKTSGQQRMFV